MDSDFKKRVECRYSQRQCSKTAVEGYQLCRSHILEDKDSPFQQCNYVSTKTGRRCVQATINPQKKEGLCLQHTTKLSRTRRVAAKKQQGSNPVTSESVLKDLGKYLDGERSVKDEVESRHEALQSAMAELASSDDSDIEERNFPADAHTWQPDSDSESIDSENEDIFKYAEVFTAEEVTRIARDKLIRLQSLYIEQFKWLQNMLRERRRAYLLAKASAEESEGKEAASNFGETYKEYRATRRYHRRYGRDALMYMKSQERRKAVCNPSATEGGHHNRYRHAFKHGTRYCSARNMNCHEKSLPFARHCIAHIENDRKQILFRRCGYEAVEHGLSCERVVLNVDEHVRCNYHTNMDITQAPQESMSTDAEVATEVIITDVVECDINGSTVSLMEESVTSPPSQVLPHEPADKEQEPELLQEIVHIV